MSGVAVLNGLVLVAFIEQFKGRGENLLRNNTPRCDVGRPVYRGLLGPPGVAEALLKLLATQSHNGPFTLRGTPRRIIR